MKRLMQIRRYTLVAACFLVVSGFFLTLIVSFPGHMSTDSMVQLMEGRTAVYQSMHPPLMSFLMGTADGIITGTFLFVAINIVISYSSMVAILNLGYKINYKTVFVIAFIICNPYILVYQGMVWKDVFFANLSVAGFLLLALSGRNQSRTVSIALCGILLLTLAALVRQQGFIVLAIGLVIVAMQSKIFAGLASDPRRVPVTLVLLACIVFSYASASSVNSLIRTTAVEPPGSRAVESGLKLLFLFDIAGTMSRQPGLDLTPFETAGIDRERFAADVSQLYTAERINYLVGGDEFRKAYRFEGTHPGLDQWLVAVTSHPISWLLHRVDHFRWQLGLADVRHCLPYRIGPGHGPRAEALNLPAPSPQSAWLKAYADKFVETPFFTNAVYLALSVFLFIRISINQPSGIAIKGMMLAGILFAGSYLAIGIACDVRYMYFTAISSMFGLLFFTLDRTDEGSSKAGSY